MNTARVELCKELYKLSGWKETDYFYQLQEYEDGSRGYSLVHPELEAPLQAEAYPAYDLGYLLRKLPPNTWVGYTDTSVSGMTMQGYTPSLGQRGYALAYTDTWTEENGDSTLSCQADTPEDAATKLAIELFKHGVHRGGRALVFPHDEREAVAALIYYEVCSALHWHAESTGGIVPFGQQDKIIQTAYERGADAAIAFLITTLKEKKA